MYDKFFSKNQEDNNYVKENKNEVKEINKKDNYQEFINNLNSNITAKYITLKSFNDERERDLVLNKDVYLYMKNDEGKEIKVISNKITDLLFIDKFSQSDNDFLFILDDKGDVYYIASSYDWTDDFDKIKPLKISELSKIVSIGCHYTSDFIDINGNKFNVENIFEKYNIQYL